VPIPSIRTPTNTGQNTPNGSATSKENAPPVNQPTNPTIPESKSTTVAKPSLITGINQFDLAGEGDSFHALFFLFSCILCFQFFVNRLNDLLQTDRFMQKAPELNPRKATVHFISEVSVKCSQKTDFDIFVNGLQFFENVKSINSGHLYIE